MLRIRLSWAAAMAAALVAPTQAHAAPAVRLPPVNLGSSSFLDGVGGPGVLLHQAFEVADGATVSMSHVAVMLPVSERVLGVGPGIGVLAGRLTLTAHVYWEVFAHDRPTGIKSVISVARMR